MRHTALCWRPPQRTSGGIRPALSGVRVRGQGRGGLAGAAQLFGWARGGLGAFGRAARTCMSSTIWFSIFSGSSALLSISLTLALTRRTKRSPMPARTHLREPARHPRNCGTPRTCTCSHCDRGRSLSAQMRAAYARALLPTDAVAAAASAAAATLVQAQECRDAPTSAPRVPAPATPVPRAGGRRERRAHWKSTARMGGSVPASRACGGRRPADTPPLGEGDAFLTHVHGAQARAARPGRGGGAEPRRGACQGSHAPRGKGIGGLHAATRCQRRDRDLLQHVGVSSRVLE